MRKTGPTWINRIILVFVRSDPFHAIFVQYLNGFCNRPEAASDVVSARFVRPIVSDKCVKFRDPGFKPFLRNSTRSHQSRYFQHFFCNNFRLKVISGVISSVAVGRVVGISGVDLYVTLKLMHRVKHMIPTLEDSERLQLHEFLGKTPYGVLPLCDDRRRCRRRRLYKVRQSYISGTA